MQGPFRTPRLTTSVDTSDEQFVTFAASEEALRVDRRGVAPDSPRGIGSLSSSELARSGDLDRQSPGYPTQLAKVQPPSLRRDVLERQRLIEWLHARINRRVLLVLADAGYGKTTLLADFSRRTRHLTIWYRLDADDRDWVALLHHLVAAVRVQSPTFGQRTQDLLDGTGPGGPSREQVVDSFLEDLAPVCVGGAILILDDFHLVDDAADARYLASALLNSGPDRMTVIFASRRLPPIPLARLRAAGEVAELGTDDLRFDLDETTALFNVTYGRELEQDVLVDLTRRTEGWVASLHMVQAALRDRSPAEIRRFVRGLTGADRELYEYLAEEVIGELDADLQTFLMRTSVLQVVTPRFSEVATELDRQTVAELTAAAERLTLLSRSGVDGQTYPRFHPLVREFLEARLLQVEGKALVVATHQRLAVAARDIDWRISAYHYREAGDTESMLASVGEAIPTIMGDGQYDLAESFIASVGNGSRPTKFDLIISRVDMQQGDYEAAIATSRAVLESESFDRVERDHALLNLVTLYLNYGDGERAVQYAERLQDSPDANLSMIAKASIAMVTGSEADDIDRINRMLVSMSRSQRELRPHHYAVTQYNLASNYIVQDLPRQALVELEPALEVLESGSAAMELAAARVMQAQALAMIGQVDEARAIIALVRDGAPRYLEDEVDFGIADLLDSFGDPGEGSAAFARLDMSRSRTPSGRRIAALCVARMLARRGQYDDASRALATFTSGRPAHLGIESARRFTGAQIAVSVGEPEGRALAEDSVRHARLQGAHRWRRCSELLVAITGDDAELSTQVAQVGGDSPQSLTFVAELIARRAQDLDQEAFDCVVRAAKLHPRRWLIALRTAVDARFASAATCGLVLEEIGEKQDIKRLRTLARESKRRPTLISLGRKLARRLADPVYVEDQGRVWFQIGQRVVNGTDIRRKVLALVCYLLCRQQLSCTRDQVLEALWPDLDPLVAVNSLNQTLYFLRRVFEENYEEDLSPNFVHHDSDVIWLDPSLVSSRSVETRALLGRLPKNPSPDDVDALVDLYQGRFALDFEYEEWAESHRDSVHAGYLEVVERAVLDDFLTGHHERGIRIARRALDIDSKADNVEVSLLRLYLVTGAHSAAAEQYAHYSSVMRDELGVEPPTLESLRG